MKKSINLCVDLVTLMKQGDLQVLDSRKGTLFRNEEDKFTFTERGAREQTRQVHFHRTRSTGTDRSSRTPLADAR